MGSSSLVVPAAASPPSIRFVVSPSSFRTLLFVVNSRSSWISRETSVSVTWLKVFLNVRLTSLGLASSAPLFDRSSCLLTMWLAYRLLAFLTQSARERKIGSSSHVRVAKSGLVLSSPVVLIGHRSGAMYALQPQRLWRGSSIGPGLFRFLSRSRTLGEQSRRIGLFGGRSLSDGLQPH